MDLYGTKRTSKKTKQNLKVQEKELIKTKEEENVIKSADVNEIKPVTITKPVNKNTDITNLETKDNNEYYEIIDKEKKHPFLKILLVLLLIILCLAAIYKYIIWNQKGIFGEGLNKTYNYISKIIDKMNDSELLNNPTNIDSVLTINSTNDQFKKISDYKFDVNFNIDADSKKYASDIQILKDNNSLLNLMYLNQHKQDYIKLDSIYDKFIALGSENANVDNLFNNINKIDYNYLNQSLKSIKNIISNNITSDKLKMGQEKIDNENYNYVSLNMIKEEYGKLITNI